MKVFLAWIVLFHFISIPIWAADTIFIESIEMPGRVSNIDCQGANLLVRLEDALYFYINGEFEKSDVPVMGQYSWFSKSGQTSNTKIYHTDYIFDDKAVRKSELDQILPGFYTNNITCATIGKTLFVCYRGVLLKYYIENDISNYYKGLSIRHVYNNDSIRIVSTYDGIFMDKIGKFTGRRLKGTYYSNGELCEINSQVYLCQDELFRLQGDTELILESSVKNGASFRKLIQWQDEVISLFNKRVSSFSTETFLEKKTLLEGDEFNDLEIFNGNLLCCSSSGKVYQIHPSGQQDTLFLEGVLHDLQTLNNEIIVSSDSGLYIINKDFQVIPISIGFKALQTASYGENIFISSLHGLYLLRRDSLNVLIPNVEFNRRALSIFNNYLYAGSVDGLYVIQLTIFDYKILPMLAPYSIHVDKGELPLILLLVIGTIILLAAGIAGYYFSKRKQQNELVLKRIQDLSLEMIGNTIRDDEDITTVNALSEKLNVSMVQLNRKLKPHGETPLSLMKKIKREIAIDMHTKGVPLDQIANRTGYSKRYIREQFLK